MVVRLEGHDCRHAVEQALLSWLPERERVWDGSLPETGDALLSRLSPGETPPRAYARLRLDGALGEGEALLEGPWPEEPLLRRRAEQRLVKTALYRALTACTGETLPWGALTGVRPAKLAARLLGETGDDPERAGAAMERIYSLSPERARLCAEAGMASRRVTRELEDRDAVLYLGIPFCPSRCAYCSFVSHSVEKSLALVEPYVDALCRELEGTAELVRETGLRLRAFYMGGGTPTTLSAAQLDRVLGLLREKFDWSACGEWTVEAGRPDTLDREKLAVLAKHGTDRISINPQTMEDRVLAAIGRKHSAADIEACFHMAREVFPGQINMDLIAGLPEDTESGFARSLDRVRPGGSLPRWGGGVPDAGACPGPAHGNRLPSVLPVPAEVFRRGAGEYRLGAAGNGVPVQYLHDGGAVPRPLPGGGGRLQASLAGKRRHPPGGEQKIPEGIPGLPRGRSGAEAEAFSGALRPKIPIYKARRAIV